MKKKDLYSYYIEKISIDGVFDDTALQLLSHIVTKYPERVLRLAFFGKPSSNDEYNNQKYVLDNLISKTFPQKPLWSYIAQAPLDCDLVVEVTLYDSSVTPIWCNFSDVDYCIVEHEGVEELFTSAIYSHTDKSIAEQSDEVFDNLSMVLSRQGYKVSDIVRQWNYIERIVDFEGERQHYQLFNDSRSRFYSSAQWSTGYPAATGIGMQYGGIIVEVNAVKESEKYVTAIDNSLQIAAHEYSQKVLIGAADRCMDKSTPKFERGKTVSRPGYETLFYISGTAAIQGEKSIDGDDVIKQAISTLENIDNLVSQKNRAMCGEYSQGSASYKMFRVYIKEESDAEVVIDYLSKRYSNLQMSYLMADVCRRELLIEIEGIAEIE